MGQQNLHDTRWFRSNPTSVMDDSNIDVENGIMYEVVMAEEGEAKGHGVSLEAEFIRNLVAYDQKYFSNTGLKARFGHPTASSETMGTQLGVFSNFKTRKKGNKLQAVAQLQLLESSNDSPTHPGMRDWVLKMAQERPDFLMSSIVFKPSGYYQRKANGHKDPMKYDPYMGDFSNRDPDKPVFVEFSEEGGAKHMYTDLVEAGAATENMFSTSVNTHLFAAQVDQFLDDNPHLRDFLHSNPKAVTAWLSRLGISAQFNTPKKMSFSLVKWLRGEDQDDNAQATPSTEQFEEMRTALNEARAEITQLRDERDEFERKFNEAYAEADRLRNETAELRTSLETLQEEIKSLSDRLLNVEKAPAAEHTAGDDDPTPSKYGNNPAAQAAKEFANRKRIPTPKV